MAGYRGQQDKTRLAFVIVASKAGAAHNPAWYHNIKAHPEDVAIEVKGKRMDVSPAILEGAERDQAWALVNDNYNGYETYQGRAGARVIPVVRLQPPTEAS
jgi:deazaflavin-dependent oxidoreductase (nitroreductase family)